MAGRLHRKRRLDSRFRGNDKAKWGQAGIKGFGEFRIKISDLRFKDEIGAFRPIRPRAGLTGAGLSALRSSK